jgi:membrane dipeptidase
MLNQSGEYHVDPAGLSDAARDLCEGGVVFDANAHPPTGDGFLLAAEHLDIVRRSGVTAVKWTLGGVAGTLDDAVRDIGFVQRMIETHPGVFMQVRAGSDFETARIERRLGIVFSFESVDMLEGRLDHIKLFRNLGVRVMQLSYNAQSVFCAGVLTEPDTGLTHLGQQAVEAMNTQGVAIDLSHASPGSSSAAIHASGQPVLITHAGCASIHRHPRNKSDEVLRAVADTGGVIGIYNLPYLAPSPKQPDLDDYMAHLLHALNTCGEDHVGVGSDASLAPWDTSPAAAAEFQRISEDRRRRGIAAPEEDRPLYVDGLNHPRRIETIADALLRRGYPARVAAKVIGGNFVRALTAIWT